MSKNANAEIRAVQLEPLGTIFTVCIDGIDQSQPHIFLLFIIQVQISLTAFRGVHHQWTELMEERWVPQQV